MSIARNFMKNLPYGYKDSKGDVSRFETNNDNLIWLKIK